MKLPKELLKDLMDEIEGGKASRLPGTSLFSLFIYFYLFLALYFFIFCYLL